MNSVIAKARRDDLPLMGKNTNFIPICPATPPNLYFRLLKSAHLSSLHLPYPTISPKKHAIKMSSRTAVVNRTTGETDIQIALSLDGGSLSFANFDVSDSEHATQTTGGQVVKVNSGIGFLDHMLHALAKHGGWSLELRCKGDLHSELFWAWEFGSVIDMDDS